MVGSEILFEKLMSFSVLRLEAYKHIEQGLDMGLTLEERQVADMLWGFAPHKWPEDLKKVAKEVTKVILHKIKNCPKFRNEANRRQYVNGIIDDVMDICDKHDFKVEIREDGFIGLELLYIRDWVLNKLNKLKDKTTLIWSFLFNFQLFVLI